MDISRNHIGLLRLSQIIGDPQADPPVPALIPVSRSGWYKGVKDGRFPQPVHFGDGRAAFWKAEDIRKLIDSLS